MTAKSSESGGLLSGGATNPRVVRGFVGPAQAARVPPLFECQMPAEFTRDEKFLPFMGEELLRVVSVTPR